MKSLYFRILALVFLLTPAVYAERVLFIGNSYTSVNNLPKIYQDITTSAGITGLEVKSITPGGRTLAQHLADERTLKLVDEGKWDAVVIQGQSQEAAMSESYENMRTAFLNGAKGLCERIRKTSPGVRIVFYQTWARHADYWKDPKADLSIGKSPEDMQTRIRKWYQKTAAGQKGAVIAPVGDAWQINYQDPKPLPLHRKDHSHPEFAGSYLAALVIYGTLHPTASLRVSYHGQLVEADAARLQEIATKARRK